METQNEQRARKEPQLRAQTLEEQVADLRLRLQMQRELISLKLTRRSKRRLRYPRSTVMRFLVRHPTMTLNLLTRAVTLLLSSRAVRRRDKAPDAGTPDQGKS